MPCIVCCAVFVPCFEQWLLLCWWQKPLLQTEMHQQSAVQGADQQVHQVPDGHGTTFGQYGVTVFHIVTFCTCIEYSCVTQSAQVQIQDQLQLTETESILCHVIYAEEQRAIRVLIPWAYRPSKD